MPGSVPVPTPIIHMTHISNLPGIVAGGLESVAVQQANGRQPTSIAYNSIQQQRALKHIPCGVGGRLHDYVPFYFTKKSPMLYTISRGNVPCDGGQDGIIHLVSTAQHIAARGHGFAFSDGHGIMSYTEFFDDLADLDQVDWNVIGATYWHDTVEDGDKKRRKQAEFLVHGVVAWSDISHVVVRTDEMLNVVQGLIAGAAHQPIVVARRDWYY